jgi:hypothetical protein
VNDPKLTLSCALLCATAKRLQRAATTKRLRTGRLGFRYQDGNLVLETPGGEDAVPAVGHWPGTARVSGMVLVTLASGKIPGESIELSFSDGTLHIRSGGAHITYKGQWEDISPVLPDIPLDASDRDYLRIPHSGYSPAQIAAAGLEKQIASCEMRFQRALDRAFPILCRYVTARSDLESVIRAVILSPRD